MVVNEQRHAIDLRRCGKPEYRFTPSVGPYSVERPALIRHLVLRVERLQQPVVSIKLGFTATLRFFHDRTRVHLVVVRAGNRFDRGAQITALRVRLATGGATGSSPNDASSSWGALDPSVSATSASAGATSVDDRSAGCACSPPLVRGRALRRGAGCSSGASSSSELTVCWARRCDNTTHPATSPIEVRHMVITTTPTTLVRSLLIFARLCSDSSRRWAARYDRSRCDHCPSITYRREVVGAPRLLVDPVDL